MAEDQLPTDRQPTLRVVPAPADTNTAGDIFGGWIMSHVDVAGAIVAARRAKGRIVTVAVKAFEFRKPVFMGDIVSFYAEVQKVGRTSISVDVEVYAERGLPSGEAFGTVVKVTDAILTYVALDDQRRPRPVDG